MSVAVDRTIKARKPGWQQTLEQALAALPSSSRRRLRFYAPDRTGSLHPQDSATELTRPLLDLCSNDYLGLSTHPQVVAAATAELQCSGLGAGASRLVSGSRPVHQQLERMLAEWLGRERALLFPSGFQANIAAVCALADRHSLVLADRLIHHSLLAGVRTSGAKLQRFGHNNIHELEARLAQVRSSDPPKRVVVLSESLFSMEGTSPDIGALVQVCHRYQAALVLDEAHALGVLGTGGRGLGQGHHDIALISGTFGKALGSGGAFLAGDACTIEWLLQSSGAFRYTTALAPPLAAGALAALEWIVNAHQCGEAPGPQLLARAQRWRDGLERAGWPRPAGHGPILPLLVGDDRRALKLQQRLEQAGLLSVAIRPPTVPEGSARLRLVLRNGVPPGSLEQLISALGPP